MLPPLRFLTNDLADKIIDEARDLLGTLGMEIHNAQAVSLLADHGADTSQPNGRIRFTADLIDKALATAPASFALFNAHGQQTHDLGGNRVHFAPGSSAINFLDPDTQKMRRPLTRDYLRYTKVVAQLPGIDAQSSAFIPSDVPGEVQDSYRLFLSLLHCAKPVITGAFSIAGLTVMKDLLLALRGSESALRDKPLALFSCAPTTPLSWSEVTCQHLLDCARAGIPVEIPTMPLASVVIL